MKELKKNLISLNETIFALWTNGGNNYRSIKQLSEYVEDIVTYSLKLDYDVEFKVNLITKLDILGLLLIKAIDTSYNLYVYESISGSEEIGPDLREKLVKEFEELYELSVKVKEKYGAKND